MYKRKRYVQRNRSIEKEIYRERYIKRKRYIEEEKVES